MRELFLHRRLIFPKTYTPLNHWLKKIDTLTMYVNNIYVTGSAKTLHVRVFYTSSQKHAVVKS